MAAGVLLAQGGARVAPHSPVLPTQVLLQQELEQLSEELDKDMRAMETRQQPRKVPAPLPPPRGGDGRCLSAPMRTHPDVCTHPEVHQTQMCTKFQLCAQPAVRPPGCACAQRAPAAHQGGRTPGWMRTQQDGRTAGSPHIWVGAQLGPPTSGWAHSWIQKDVPVAVAPWKLGPSPAAPSGWLPLAVRSRSWTPSLPAETRPLG